jgi:hypothetical protein
LEDIREGGIREAEMSGSERVNTTLSGSARVDDIKGHPKGELRGQSKSVNITEDVRKFAAQQKISERDALQIGLEQKAKEFKESGADVYAKM